jgi:valyl-tRNA synthetase
VHVEVKSFLEGHGFEQDPDVLDTWFSSALWPISTMGWPQPRDFPETIGLLETFNPSSVLVTARDIITLWVSRMVMFNRYFREGVLPFFHVYINPLIQDGHGQRMSKSLGNGVDPRDIIHSHGADAMRFVLVQMATSTQDVRMPVDMVCPHCGRTVHPEETVSPAGYRVAAPKQVCPKCTKPMASAYGGASGLAAPTDRMPLARNTSSKFDLGRNFANKLWNAARFALGNLEHPSDDATKRQSDKGELTLVDRWILNRLHRTLHVVEDAMEQYQFNVYAEAMYDLVWRDFCDWYIESIKPTVKSSPGQQQVLRTVLSAILRMLHPICPFVTETLWPHLQATGEAGIDGINLPPSELASTAAWPEISPRAANEEAAHTYGRVQALTSAIRTLRAENQVPQKKMIRLSPEKVILEISPESPALVRTLAGAETVDAVGPDAIPLAFEGAHLQIGGLVETVDLGAERNRLKSLVQEKERAVAAFRRRLANDSYIAKAPRHLVQETKDLLAQAEADLVAARRALELIEG